MSESRAESLPQNVWVVKERYLLRFFFPCFLWNTLVTAGWLKTLLSVQPLKSVSVKQVPWSRPDSISQKSLLYCVPSDCPKSLCSGGSGALAPAESPRPCTALQEYLAASLLIKEFMDHLCWCKTWAAPFIQQELCWGSRHLKNRSWWCSKTSPAF